ncbi:DUF2281 domain-containing protein [Thermoleptolyngbya oregonensis NK1-22]|uniref:DUF2281 domain-containing protein n=2 Tax=Thermoleptolyngbya TaxID=2303528 RepID=A0AA96YAE8_9CYAN|nr:DUF2281 domain-containing protein [Thermoleptolyngbya oregonensis NK1-22]
MSTADQIYELVKAMPEQESRLVLVFAKFVINQLNSERQPVSGLLSDYLGILKDSPNFNEDPVELQRAMRNEWS